MPKFDEDHYRQYQVVMKPRPYPQPVSIVELSRNQLIAELAKAIDTIEKIDELLNDNAIRKAIHNWREDMSEEV